MPRLPGLRSAAPKATGGLPGLKAQPEIEDEEVEQETYVEEETATSATPRAGKPSADIDMSFIATGDTARQWGAENKASMSALQGKNEFYVTADKSGRIVVADPLFFASIWIHPAIKFWKGKKIPVDLPCSRKSFPCEYCKVAVKEGTIGPSYPKFYWRIYDLAEWKGKDNKVHKVTPRLWPLSGGRSEAIEKQVLKHGGSLANMILDVDGGKTMTLSFSPLDAKTKALLSTVKLITMPEFAETYKPLAPEEQITVIEQLMGGSHEEELAEKQAALIRKKGNQWQRKNNNNYTQSPSRRRARSLNSSRPPSTW